MATAHKGLDLGISICFEFSRRYLIPSALAITTMVLKTTNSICFRSYYSSLETKWTNYPARTISSPESRKKNSSISHLDWKKNVRSRYHTSTRYVLPFVWKFRKLKIPPPVMHENDNQYTNTPYFGSFSYSIFPYQIYTRYIYTSVYIKFRNWTKHFSHEYNYSTTHNPCPMVRR